MKLFKTNDSVSHAFANFKLPTANDLLTKTTNELVNCIRDL